MPIEGHGWDCDCGCCDVEESPAAGTAPNVCVCPACGKNIPTEAGMACSEKKCPKCGAAMKPGQ